MSNSKTIFVCRKCYKVFKEDQKVSISINEDMQDCWCIEIEHEYYSPKRCDNCQEEVGCPSFGNYIQVVYHNS